MTPEIRQFKANALKELQDLKSVSDGIMERLQKSCPISVAYEIVDNLWTPAEAMRIKTELSTEFPERNGNVILNTPFTGKVSMLMSIPQTLEFFEKAFPEIIEKVTTIYKQINDMGLNDPEAIEKYNAFRKEPARFADYVRDLFWYPDSEALQKGQIKSWKDVTEESVSVENGDYLLLVDYGEFIRKSQAKLKESLLDSLNNSDMRLGFVNYKASQLVGMVQLVGLFSDYLDDFEPA